MFFVSFCLWGAMSLSVYIMKMFLFVVVFCGFLVFYFVQHFGQQWLYYFVL